MVLKSRIEKRSPAQNALCSVPWTLRVGARTVVIIICVVPILNELSDIPVHVVETPGIRMKMPDRMDFLIRVTPVPGQPLKIICVLGRGARAAGVFPFGFGRQAVGISIVGLIQTRDKLLRVVPGNELHRKIIAFEVRMLAAHDGFPFTLRHFVTSEEEIPANAYAVSWFFVGLSVFRAHHETAGRERHELDTDSVLYYFCIVTRRRDPEQYAGGHSKHHYEHEERAHSNQELETNSREALKYLHRRPSLVLVSTFE